MKIGDKVKVVRDFSEESAQWGCPYPEIGKVLTISDITNHPNEDMDNKGVKVLYFDEMPKDTPGLCDKMADGQPNFIKFEPMRKDEIINNIDQMINHLTEGDKFLKGSLFIHGDTEDQTSRFYMIGDIQVISSAFIELLHKNDDFRPIMMSMFSKYLSESPIQKKAFMAVMNFMANNTPGVN